jgi:hypothetical protein
MPRVQRETLQRLQKRCRSRPPTSTARHVARPLAQRLAGGRLGLCRARTCQCKRIAAGARDAEPLGPRIAPASRPCRCESRSHVARWRGSNAGTVSQRPRARRDGVGATQSPLVEPTFHPASGATLVYGRSHGTKGPFGPRWTPTKAAKDEEQGLGGRVVYVGLRQCLACVGIWRDGTRTGSHQYTYFGICRAWGAGATLAQMTSIPASVSRRGREASQELMRITGVASPDCCAADTALSRRCLTPPGWLGAHGQNERSGHWGRADYGFRVRSPRSEPVTVGRLRAGRVRPRDFCRRSRALRY